MRGKGTTCRIWVLVVPVVVVALLGNDPSSPSQDQLA
uniref:Transmembrane protein n=1 Tax=Ralstonia solanacearum TaxID=305 RepID=A0A0S4TN97_RALSL|nr:protein of unknown function [Ralstonia solanacearum]